VARERAAATRKKRLSDLVFDTAPRKFLGQGDPDARCRSRPWLESERLFVRYVFKPQGNVPVRHTTWRSLAVDTEDWQGVPAAGS